MSLAGLKGKTAIVTGGAQGIGAAIVDRLLEEGCDVSAVDIDGKKLKAFAATRPQAHLMPLTADVSNEAQCERYFSQTVERFGRIDCMVNNAGILTPVRPLSELSVADFEQAFQINVRSVFLGMRAAIRQMEKQGTGGSIVNISSLAALRAAPKRSFYGSTKRAILGLSNSAALENARAGIRVNTILPGPVATPMSRQVDATRAKVGGNLTKEYPLGRKGEPAEIAALVAWLLSSEASYATGGVYTLDGAVSA